MAKILHRIKATLYDNPLTDDPNDLIARVIAERSLGVGQVCESAVSRGGADIPAASMEHAVFLFLKEMAYLLCDGFSINTGYFTVTVLIKGVFNSPNELFDPTKHSIVFQFNQGDTLRKELPSIEVQILGVTEGGTSIAQVIDVKTGSVNDLLTPERNLKISGNRIKLAGDHPSVGARFVNTESGIITAIDPSDIVVNNPSELIVVNPLLAPGNYRLEIVTQYAVSSLLKEPRTVVFDKILTVL
jgi:hypothetical protein